MARVSLIEEHEHPELSAQIAKIRGGRRGTLSMIYRLMLHSPAAAMATPAATAPTIERTRLVRIQAMPTRPKG